MFSFKHKVKSQKPLRMFCLQLLPIHYMYSGAEEQEQQ